MKGFERLCPFGHPNACHRCPLPIRLSGWGLRLLGVWYFGFWVTGQGVGIRDCGSGFKVQCRGLRASRVQTCVNISLMSWRWGSDSNAASNTRNGRENLLRVQR